MRLTLPKIIAHRGDRAFAPENTLVAIRQAAAKGARWVEFDATLCADTSAPVVIFHDDRIGRTTNGGDRALTEVGFAELRALDAGGWFAPQFAGEQVPTLAEVVALCRQLGLGMNIEIKVSETGAANTPEPFDVALAQLTARRVVEDLGEERADILLSSFSTEALLVAKALLPEVPRGYLLHSLWPEDAADPNWPEFRRRLGLVSPATVNLNEVLITGVGVVAKAEGRPVLAYTVNDVARAQALLALGVASIFTDDPGVMLAAFG